MTHPGTMQDLSSGWLLRMMTESWKAYGEQFYSSLAFRGKGSKMEHMFLNQLFCWENMTKRVFAVAFLYEMYCMCSVFSSFSSYLFFVPSRIHIYRICGSTLFRVAYFVLILSERR